MCSDDSKISTKHSAIYSVSATEQQSSGDSRLSAPTEAAAPSHDLHHGSDMVSSELPIDIAQIDISSYKSGYSEDVDNEAGLMDDSPRKHNSSCSSELLRTFYSDLNSISASPTQVQRGVPSHNNTAASEPSINIQNIKKWSTIPPPSSEQKLNISTESWSSHNTSNSKLKPALKKCKLCDYTSKYSANIYRHMRIHTGEKPYACPHCSYKASQSNSLHDHIALKHSENSEVRLYKCSQCAFSARGRSAVKKHIRRVHPSPSAIVNTKIPPRAGRRGEHDPAYNADHHNVIQNEYPGQWTGIYTNNSTQVAKTAPTAATAHHTNTSSTSHTANRPNTTYNTKTPNTLLTGDEPHMTPTADTPNTSHAASTVDN